MTMMRMRYAALAWLLMLLQPQARRLSLMQRLLCSSFVSFAP